VDSLSPDHFRTTQNRLGKDFHRKSSSSSSRWTFWLSPNLKDKFGNSKEKFAKSKSISEFVEMLLIWGLQMGEKDEFRSKFPVDYASQHKTDKFSQDVLLMQSNITRVEEDPEDLVETVSRYMKGFKAHIEPWDSLEESYQDYHPMQDSYEYPPNVVYYAKPVFYGYEEYPAYSAAPYHRESMNYEFHTMMKGAFESHSKAMSNRL
jgi:hypothetical protein